MIKIVRRHAKFTESMTKSPLWSHVALSFLLPQVEGSEYQQKILKAVRSVSGWENEVPPNLTEWPASIEPLLDGGLVFTEGPLSLTLSDVDLEYWKHNRIQPTPVIQKLVQSVFAIVNREPVLLVGPTGFKTELTKILSRLLGRQNEAVTLHLTSDTETHDLLGQVEPVSFKELIKILLKLGNEVFARCKVLAPDFGKHKYRINREKSLEQILGKGFKKTLLDFAESRLKTVSATCSDTLDIISNASWEQGSVEQLSESLSSTEISALSESNVDGDALAALSESLGLETSECTSDGEGKFDSFSGLDSDEDDFCIVDRVPLDEKADSAENVSESVSDSHDALKEDTETVPGSDWAFESIHKDTNLSVSTGSASVCSSAIHAIPEEVFGVVEYVLLLLEEIIAWNFPGGAEPGLDRLLHRFKNVWKEIQGTDPVSGDPVFMFMDGPVPRAVNVGQILVLEDWDKSRQSVTERLNRVTDVDPVFCIPEDITGATNGSYKDIQVPNKFHLLATIHAEGSKWNANLSTATRSRFTIISVPDYSKDDLQQLLASELRNRLHKTTEMEPGTIVKHILGLQKLVQEEPTICTYNDVHQLFRWVDFLCNDCSETKIEHQIVLGGKYFYLDELKPGLQSRLLEKWWGKLNFGYDMPPYFDVTKGISTQGHGDLFRVKYTEENIAYGIELTYAGLIGKLKSPEAGLTDHSFQERLKDCTHTPSYLMNCARIFAAVSARSATLLGGPPGIGKSLQ